MPRRSAQRVGSGVATDHGRTANIPCVIDLADQFTPKDIANAFLNLWSLDKNNLVPTKDDSGQSPICPITLEPMTNPTLVSDGQLYEGPAILEWLQNERRSPCTNLPLPSLAMLRLQPLKAILQRIIAMEAPPVRSKHQELHDIISGTKTHVGRNCYKQLSDLRALIAESTKEARQLQSIIENATSLAEALQERIVESQCSAAIMIQSLFRRRQALRLAVHRRATRTLKAACQRFSARRLLSQLIDKAYVCKECEETCQEQIKETGTDSNTYNGIGPDDTGQTPPVIILSRTNSRPGDIVMGKIKAEYGHEQVREVCLNVPMIVSRNKQTGQIVHISIIDNPTLKMNGLTSEMSAGQPLRISTAPPTKGLRKKNRKKREKTGSHVQI